MLVAGYHVFLHILKCAQPIQLLIIISHPTVGIHYDVCNIVVPVEADQQFQHILCGCIFWEAMEGEFTSISISTLILFIVGAIAEVTSSLKLA